MKIANPEVVDTLNTALDKKPRDSDLVIGLFSDDDRMVASLLVGKLFQTLDLLEARSEENLKIQKETKDLVATLLKDKDSTNVNPTTLAHFFNNNPEILEDFSFENNSISYKGNFLGSDSEQLITLSLKLEDNFGTKHVPFSTLLMAMKRYFVAKKNSINYLKEFVETQCEDYLSDYKTKKRTKIPMKFLKGICSELPAITTDTLRLLMSELGYEETKNNTRSVFFSKVVE